MKISDIENDSNEIRNLLKNDETALGQVFLAWDKIGDNKTYREISEQAKVPLGTVGLYVLIIRQLLQINDLPSTTAQCRNIANEIRRFKNRSTVENSETVSSTIDSIVEKLLVKSEDPTLVARENRENNKKAERFNQGSGIYVYTYPHYHKNPEVKSTADSAERYHLKVGKTNKKFKERLSQQTTGMPEAPLSLLFIIASNGKKFAEQPELMDDVERKIHGHLEIIGHSNVKKRGGGKEWFLSNKETIFSIADLMGLEAIDPDEPC